MSKNDTNPGVYPLYAFCVREYAYASRINFIFA